MLNVRMLGQFEVGQDSKRLVIPTRHAQALFAFLVLNTGRRYRREQLAGLLWPDSSEENARSNLRHELWRLRKALETEGNSYFLVDDLTIAFDPNSRAFLDVEILVNKPVIESSGDDLVESVSVYKGDLLPGFYDDWVEVERERLAALFEAKMSHLIEILEAEERWAEVLDWGERWIALGDWPEPAYRALMNAYASTGDLSKAAAIYERFTNGVQRDLGIDPSEQTQALYQRLKAIAKTEAAHVVITSSELPRTRLTNLPKPMTSFIGRENEIQQVERLVSKTRLVTITGSGGVGKTRLAIQAGKALASRFKDGVWWVELASLFRITPAHQPDLANLRNSQTLSFEQVDEITRTDPVIQAVAQILRVPDVPGQILLEDVLDYLQPRQLLLILDNCEHLIEGCAALVGKVLSNCPDVTILATSREVLGVPGEKAWRLPSLSLPQKRSEPRPIRKFQSEAVDLFVERVSDIFTDYLPVETDVPIIDQICIRLDGIPLAIELAAARMSLLTAREIADRLDSRFSLLAGGYRTGMPRHQTLSAAIEWSFDLLDPEEQILFRRLSVFDGGFTLDAAEAVCVDSVIHRQGVLSLVGRLVDKSLLNVEPARQGMGLPTRYQFLETIHSFASMKLQDAKENKLLRDHHAAYYMRLVEIAEPELLLQNQVHWFRLLQAEYDNLRRVFEWSAESNQAEPALRLSTSLLWFWFSYGSTREGSDLALKALSLPSAVDFVEARTRALNKAGFLLYLLGDLVRARQLLEEAIIIQRNLKDEENLAWSLQFLGLVLANEKDYDLANSSFQEGLTLTRKLKGGHTNNFLHFLGDVYLEKGDRPKAKKIYEESVSILKEIGSKSFLAYPLRRLGYVALWENDIPKAQIFFQESLATNVEIGDQRAVAACLVSLAALAIRLHKPVMAACLYGVVENLLESLSVNLLNMDQVELKQITNDLASYMGVEECRAAFAEGWELSVDKAIDMSRELLKG